MTRITGIAVVLVSRNPIVITIGFGLSVTGKACKYAIITCIGMTITALIPLSLMFSAENGEVHVVVIPVGRRPCRLTVATCTIGGEAGSQVVGAVGRIVSGSMASVTSIRRIVVIAVMTSGTIVGNRSMSSCQYIIGIVVREGSRSPTRICCMAGDTIGRQAQ